jgi:hypothetical protein
MERGTVTRIESSTGDSIRDGAWYFTDEVCATAGANETTIMQASERKTKRAAVLVDINSSQCMAGWDELQAAAEHK